MASTKAILEVSSRSYVPTGLLQKILQLELPNLSVEGAAKVHTQTAIYIYIISLFGQHCDFDALRVENKGIHIPRVYLAAMLTFIWAQTYGETLMLYPRYTITHDFFLRPKHINVDSTDLDSRTHVRAPSTRVRQVPASHCTKSDTPLLWYLLLVNFILPQ